MTDRVNDVCWKTKFAPHPPRKRRFIWRSIYFSSKCLFLNLATRAWIDDADRMRCLKCDLPELLEASRPPDSELVNLIEQAFLEGQIDGLRADLAYLWIQANRVICLG